MDVTSDQLRIALAIGSMPCGDVLKAALLNQFAGTSINLVMLRTPTGNAEKAFADERAKQASDTAPKSAGELLQAFKADHAKVPVVETLPKMPKSIVFEDVDPEAEAAERLSKAVAESVATAAPEVSPAADGAEPQALANGEFDIGGHIHVTMVRAAELRGTSNLKTIMATATNQKWRRVRHPEDGRHPLYLKEDVVARFRGGHRA